MKDIQMNFKVSKQMRDEIKMCAEEKEVPMAIIIRTAVKNFLRENIAKRNKT